MTDASAGGLGRRIASSLEQLTLHKVREEGFRNASINQARIAASSSVLELRKTPLAQGDTAIVMAAGPSLHRRRVAEQIKASGFRGVIVATESALGYCLRNDLVPDLIVTLDPHPTRIVRWLGDPRLSEARLNSDDYFRRQDLEPRLADDQLAANRELLQVVNQFGPRVRAAICTSAAPEVVDRIYDAGMTPYWWNPFYDDYDAPDSLTRKIHRMNGLPCLNAGGNVGSAAWVLAAAVLEKKQIGIVGMDFGYYNDLPYEKTQYYREIVDLVGPDRLDEVYVRVHNPHVNADFYTDPTYLWYRDSFLEMVREADSRTVNCTEGGILFGEGLEVMPLAEFLASGQRS